MPCYLMVVALSELFILFYFFFFWTILDNSYFFMLSDDFFPFAFVFSEFIYSLPFFWSDYIILSTIKQLLTAFNSISHKNK